MKKTFISFLFLSNVLLAQQVKLPYPIIFVHGLNSSSDTWQTTVNYLTTTLGLINGGRLDFCLNQDANNAIANKNIYPAPNADIRDFTNLASLVVGDFYLVNFDVGNNGSLHPGSGTVNFVLSNQEAVVKQGLALKLAISSVLQKTGRDKVVLIGHSMGGLASREYLQNSSDWQPDGQHHVAKLVTTGTPHGGSNASSFASSLAGIDLYSSAVRDLRSKYSASLDSGVFLFSGVESFSVIDDFTSTSSNFYTVDVNCNGIVSENITGLNKKSINADIDYACIIGNCSNCFFGQELPGDGVVNSTSANLKTFYPGLNVNLFNYNSSTFLLTEIHTSLPGQYLQNMEGLDEPDNNNLAYAINFDINYKGFTTAQATANTNYPVDHDLYKFVIGAPSTLIANISSITLSNLSVKILNSSNQLVGTIYNSGGNSSINLSQGLNAGSYYLDIYGTVAAQNNITPYSFKILDCYPDDGNACTIDACNTITGSSTHIAVNVDDANVCTIDGCNSISGVFHNPATEICGNNIDDNCNGQVDEGCNVTLNIKVFIQGFYLGHGAMIASADPSGHPSLCDSIAVELHTTTSPYVLVHRVFNTINVSGNGQFIFPPDVLTHSYYIVIRHRNSLETWSKNPVLFNGSTINFDFTRL